MPGYDKFQDLLAQVEALSLEELDKLQRYISEQRRAKIDEMIASAEAENPEDIKYMDEVITEVRHNPNTQLA